MRKVIKYQLIVLFFGILFLPLINDGLNFIHFERKDENRRFRDSLSIDISHLDDFPQEAEDYINDNFSFREPLLMAFPIIKFYGFNTSPKPEKTIIGKGGWMFMAENEVDCYSGKLDFTKAQLDLLNETWKKRVAYFESKGIKCYWLIAPIKHSVYSSKLPFNILKSKNMTRVEQVKGAIENDIPDLIIDPSEELRRKSDEEKVFYKMDNHWNFRGGRIAYEMLIQKIKADFTEISKNSNFGWKDTLLKRGIHYNVMGLDNLSEVDYIPLIYNKKADEVEKFGFDWPHGFAYYWEYERHFKNPSAGNNLKVLVIRDSFGEQMMPFIVENFGESLFIFDAWQYKLNEKIIESYKPDIVVYITVENLIESLLKEY